MDSHSILHGLKELRSEVAEGLERIDSAITAMESKPMVDALAVLNALNLVQGSTATPAAAKEEKPKRKRARKSRAKKRQVSPREQQKLNNKREILIFVAEQGGDSALPTTMIRNKFTGTIAESTMTRYLRELVESGDLASFEQNGRYYYRIPAEPTELVREAQEEIRLNVTTHRPLTEDEQRDLGNGVIRVVHTTEQPA